MSGQTGAQRSYRIFLFEIDVPAFDAAPLTFTEDIVQAAAVIA